MKRFDSAVLTLTVLISIMLSNTVNAAPSSVQFDFEQDDAGFVPIFADYPAEDGVDAFYELAYGHDNIPIENAGKGLFLSGNNHSDDLFMGYYKELDELPSNEQCVFKIKFKLGTNVDGGLIGIGGSPGSSVYVKCGIASEKPLAVVSENNNYRLNMDKGNQGTGGNDMEIIGNIEKKDGVFPGKYEFKDFEATVEMTPNEEGKAYLIIGTDSGFEGTTSYYLDDIEIEWVEKKNEIVSRAQAIQLLYENTFSSPAGAPVFCDVDSNSPYWYAIGWAQNHNYISGHGNGMFAPDENMTVEQAMIVLYRYAGSPVVSFDENLESVSPWARNAVSWGLQQGLIQKSDISNHLNAIRKSTYIDALQMIVR